MQGKELRRDPRGTRRHASRARDHALQWRADGVRGRVALAILERIGNENRKGEFYLTDAVATARDMGLKAVAMETTEDEVRGINTRRNSPRPKTRCSSACAKPRWTPASR